MNEPSENAGARVRVLVVGALSPNPPGSRFTVTAKRFDEILKAAAVAVRINIGEKTFALHFERLKSFRLESVIAAVPELAGLSALAEELGTPAAARLDPNDIVARVKAASGAGPLADRVASLLVKPAQPAPAPASAPTSAIDSIFAQADLPQAGRDERPGSSPFEPAAVRGALKTGPKNSSGALRQTRAALEDFVFSTASSLLKNETVARLETAWRSLKLLAEASGGDEILVEALDATAEGAPALVAALEREPAFERPDLFIILDPISRIEDLSSWAAIGESLLAPVLTSISDEVFGGDPAALSDKTHVQHEAWTELRSAESSRWIAVAVNRMVLALEGAGNARRVVFTSAAVSVGASIIASFRNTGTFGRIIGPATALRAPETWSLPSGREAGTTSPLEHFLGIQAQRDLATFGLIALGAAKNSDRVILTAAPTARRSPDAVPLPAQLLTGRIVRFAEWCREQIPRETPDDQIAGLFKEAAEVLLFPAAQGAATLSAEMIGEDGKKKVLVRAGVLASYGGTPFELEFALP